MKVSTGGDGMILASGAPITGEEAKIFKTSKPVSVKITMASCTKKWNSVTHNDKGTYQNIMMMEPTGSRTTTGGYSGAPVLVEFKNAGTTHYKICGVYKGGSADAGTTRYNNKRCKQRLSICHKMGCIGKLFWSRFILI